MLDRVRLALRPPRLAVVLGGGGARGAYEVGVIEALVRAGIVPDLLVGTSVGAINATYWAFHPDADAAQRLLAIWLDVDRSVLLPTWPFATLRQLLRGESLVSSQGLLALLGRGLTSSDAIEDARLPLTVVAADPELGRAVRLRSGPAIPAVLASCAVPGIFPAVQVSGRMLVDGGLLANCDVVGAVEQGATDVLAVDIMGAPSRLPARDLLLTVERSLDLTLGGQTTGAVAAVAGRARVALLRAPGAIMPRFGRFSATRSLFEAGLSAGERMVAEHLRGRRVVPGILTVEGA